ncbi:uncharacterized protein LOC135389292 [Ornithodoros turicata]|uniref:uncharacterized protein LOC135389292 n=1 Tax=Ornithodoros turicata TaxID=34597 RepID=UPI00313914E1
MSVTPKFAYVVYKDGGKAIVSTTLIKKYAPSDVNDLAKNKFIYWETADGDESTENYYPGDVVLLGVSKNDLVQRMTKKKIPVPDNVFEDEKEAAQVQKADKEVIQFNISQIENGLLGSLHFRRKKKKKRAAATRKRKMTDLFSGEEESSGDELVERRKLREERERNKELRKKVRHVQAKLDAIEARYERLEARNEKLQDLLEIRLEAWFCSSVQRDSSSTSSPRFNDSGTSTVTRVVNRESTWKFPPRQTDFVTGDIFSVTEVVDTSSVPCSQNEGAGFDDCAEVVIQSQVPASQLPVCSQLPEVASTDYNDLGFKVVAASTAASQIVPSCSQASTNSASDLPLLSEVDGQVHLGKGIFVTNEQWEWLLARRRDSLFCKEAVKMLWPISELRNRSITGAPCRRLKQSGAQGRKALTPVKLEAVASMTVFLS